MIFSLEAIQARHGDSLIVHYGSADAPRFIVIDGGPATVFENGLQPRLDEIKEARHPDDDALPIQLLMVSHIDDDHIRGVLDLFEHLVDLEQAHETKPYRILRFWHNSFDEILGNGEEEIFSDLPAGATAAQVEALLPSGTGIEPDVAAVVASVGQGRALRRDAKRLNLTPNEPFEGLVMAPATGGRAFELAPAHELRIRVVNPDERRVRSLHAKWEAELTKAAQKKTSALAAAFTDRSVFNLASIVALLELDGARMLLTGDARGDDILAGLEAAGLLDGGGGIQLDLLKVPHHGSDRNVSTEFFRKVRARHYVISANGEHDNPDIATLKMLSEARPDDEFTVHLTNEDGENAIGPKMRAFSRAESENDRKYRVRFRDGDDLSLIVDLRDPVDY